MGQSWRLPFRFHLPSLSFSLLLPTLPLCSLLNRLCESSPQVLHYAVPTVRLTASADIHMALSLTLFGFCAHVTLTQDLSLTHLVKKKKKASLPVQAKLPVFPALFFFPKPLTTQHIIYLFTYCLSFPLRIRTWVITVSPVSRIVPAYIGVH